MSASGGTNFEAALQQAVTFLQGAGPGINRVFFVSDGENNEGAAYDDFTRLHRSFPPALQSVPVFTILFGDANRREMSGIAELTGGRLFDAQNEPLSTIFKEIRGYQ